MDDPDGYLELFRTVHAEVPDALVYPTYPNGEMVDRYKHVKALMEDPASGLAIAPIIAGSADLTPPLDYARNAPTGDWLLHMGRDDSGALRPRLGVGRDCATLRPSPPR